MNKTIFFLILAVCILGMALILLNQRLGRDPEPRARAGQTVVSEAAPAEPLAEAPGERREAADLSLPALPPQGQADAPQAGQRTGADAAAEALARERALELERQEAVASLSGRDVSGPSAAAQPAAPAQGGTVAPPTTTAADHTAPPAAARPTQPAQDAPKQAAAPRQTAPAREPDTVTKPAPEKQAAAGAGKATTAEKAGAEKNAAKPAQQAKSGNSRAISRFVVFARETGATVRLTGNGPLRYKSMNLDNPDRVVLDLEGDWDVKAPAVPKNPLVSAVRVGELDGRTRVVIDLKAKPRATRVIPARDGNGVDIRVDQ